MLNISSKLNTQPRRDAQLYYDRHYQRISFQPMLRHWHLGAETFETTDFRCAVF